MNNILKVLRYFSIFNYAPTASEIRFYSEAKISEKALQNKLNILIGKGKVMRLVPSNFKFQSSNIKSNSNEKSIKGCINSMERYTLVEYSLSSKELNFKLHHSSFKIRQIERYVSLLKWFPQIQLVGLSGSVAMMNATKDDDIDLFIISKQNRMWTARFLAVFFASLLNLRRNRSGKNTSNKVCLNMFLDETALKMPKFKQNFYIAHEVLQMKPIINKNNSYQKFLIANRWVFKVFPNSRIILNDELRMMNDESRLKSKFPNTKYQIPNTIGIIIESMLKQLQLILINRTKTTEIVTNKQLWFHPNDFEKKIDF